MNPTDLLKGYDVKHITIGVLGGHSALDVCHGAKKEGFRTVCVAKAGRSKTYDYYYRSRKSNLSHIGCIDDVIPVQSFDHVLNDDVQETLRSMNTIFIHNRYFWVYFGDYSKIEKEFEVPIFGNRSYVKLEERDQSFNQYHLLRDAGIPRPRIYKDPKEIDRPVIVKASEAKRAHERGFFLCWNEESYEAEGSRLEKTGKIASNWRKATIEEFIVGAPVNFNFFYSPLQGELELMGTDTRRQTNLDGFLRMTSDQQQTVLPHIDLKMIETGHIACTVKESLLERAFDLGERFIEASRRHDGKGIIGPFALQGAVIAEEGKEDIVIFDVSLRIPGSPGTRFTPYSGYLYGENKSYGERIAMEIRRAVQTKRLEEVVT